MSSPDELQQLWLTEAAKQENRTMWDCVVEEKRASFSELVRTENSSEYLVAAILAPLLVLTASRANDPFVQAGYALLAAAVCGLAVATWLIYRNRALQVDKTLGDHLSALIREYDERIAFLRRATFATGTLLSIGVMLIFVSKGSAAGWLLALFMLALFWGGSALRLQRRRTDLLNKRLQVEAIIRKLEN